MSSTNNLPSVMKYIVLIITATIVAIIMLPATFFVLSFIPFSNTMPLLSISGVVITTMILIFFYSALGISIASIVTNVIKAIQKKSLLNKIKTHRQEWLSEIDSDIYHLVSGDLNRFKRFKPYVRVGINTTQEQLHKQFKSQIYDYVDLRFGVSVQKLTNRHRRTSIDIIDHVVNALLLDANTQQFLNQILKEFDNDTTAAETEAQEIYANFLYNVKLHSHSSKYQNIKTLSNNLRDCLVKPYDNAIANLGK